jgi:hypothetical protein
MPTLYFNGQPSPSLFIYPEHVENPACPAMACGDGGSSSKGRSRYALCAMPFALCAPRYALCALRYALYFSLFTRQSFWRAAYSPVIHLPLVRIALLKCV